MKKTKLMNLWTIGEMIIGIILAVIIFTQSYSTFAGVISIIIAFNALVKLILKEFF